jgi:hypothetical protein
MLVVNAIQLTGEEARHVHSRATTMFSVPVPPEGPKAVADGVTVASQRLDAGAVTVVDVVAELPQAAVRTASTNSRGVRTVTGRVLAQASPAQFAVIRCPYVLCDII